jgi:hypothetical protein
MKYSENLYSSPAVDIWVVKNMKNIIVTGIKYGVTFGKMCMTAILKVR